LPESGATGCAVPSDTVKWKVLPWRSWLSNQIRPPINSTSAAAMDKPNPEPPYFRVEDPSTWVNGSKI
jgi:hypothetical protein